MNCGSYSLSSYCALVQGDPIKLLELTMIELLFAGATGAMDAVNLLKPMLGQGELCCIGATITEYHEYIEKDPALE